MSTEPVTTSVTHVALFVANVPGAERFYCSLLGLSVAFREVDTGDGWRTVPADREWDEVRAAGFEPGMSFLVRGDFGLALEAALPGVPGAGVLSHVGLWMPAADLDRLGQAAPAAGCSVVQARADLLVFVDPNGVRWEVADAPLAAPADQSNGVRRGRWLEM